MSAAYNAGPEAVAGWNTTGASDDPVAFVETIPYMETRGYVKKVLRNYGEYRRLYGGAGAASLPPVSPVAGAPEASPPQAASTLICRATGSCAGAMDGR